MLDTNLHLRGFNKESYIILFESHYDALKVSQTNSINSLREILLIATENQSALHHAYRDMHASDTPNNLCI